MSVPKIPLLGRHGSAKPVVQCITSPPILAISAGADFAKDKPNQLVAAIFLLTGIGRSRKVGAMFAQSEGGTMKKRMWFGVVALGLLGLGCHGEHEHMEGVGTWHTMVNGVVTEVGISIEMSTVNSVDHDSGMHAGVPYDAQLQTFINHVGVGYHPAGHGPPGVNDVPHYDVHFYHETMEEREAIECGDQPNVPALQIPEGVEDPPEGGEPFGSCVAAMGVHSSAAYDKLDAEMIYGFNNGKLSFVEPMIHEDNLKQKKELEFTINPPPKFGEKVNYPHRSYTFYDEMDDTYNVVLTDFRIID
jgi:hypothetical protein